MIFYDELHCFRRFLKVVETSATVYARAEAAFSCRRRQGEPTHRAAPPPQDSGTLTTVGRGTTGDASEAAAAPRNRSEGGFLVYWMVSEGFETFSGTSEAF